MNLCAWNSFARAARERLVGGGIAMFTTSRPVSSGGRRSEEAIWGPRNIAAERFKRLSFSGLADRDRFKRYILKSSTALKLQI